MTHDKDIEYERVAAEAEEHKDDPIPEGAKVSRGHDHTQVLKVPLNEDELAKLIELAGATDVPVSTLARSILIDTILGRDQEGRN